MAVIPPFNPQDRIPNDPFYNPNANRYNLSYPTGQLVFGDYLFVDYATGNVYISPNAPNNGTVTQITAGAQLETSPATGITTTGSIGLKAISTIVPGSYTYATIAVNGYGKLTLALNGPTPLTSLIGTAPVYVSGSNPTLSLGITGATTTSPGAVQIVDSLSSNDGTRALSAQQGYNLGLQMSFLGNTLAGQVFAGTINTATGNIAQLTTGGAALGGFAVGSPLPAGAPVYDNAFFVLLSDGTYTPPGGVATAVVKDDRVICINSNWQILLCGTRLASASAGTAGLTVLATSAEVQARTEANKSVTAGSLSVMVASETQDGFVELATTAETQAFTDNTRAVTAASLGTLQATTTTRGFVMLSDSVSDPSVTAAPTANALKFYADSSLDTATVTANGDIIVGMAYQTPGILTKGTNGSVLTVDDTKPTQGFLDWNTADSLNSWPVGGIIWQLSTAPLGGVWMECDGRLLDGDINGPYYNLYEIIGTTYNQPSDPAGFFRIPDLRGQFIRGWRGSGTNPTPTALDPGRTFASCQGTAFLQHCHGVTDPGHCMPMPLTAHCHPTTIVNHSHGVSDPGHCHYIWNFVTSEVVGNDAGWYDSEGVQYGCHDGISTERTNITINSGFTGVTVNTCTTGLTVNTATTNLTVDNSPPVAPTPDESRPVNVALLPVIKYGLVPAGPTPPPPPPPVPTYVVNTTPTAATENTVITTTVTTTNVSTGTTLYWQMSGTGITGAFFTSGVLTGTVIVTANSASFTQILAASLPGPGPYTLSVDLFSDAARSIQVGTTSLVIAITPGVTPSTPLLGSYIDLWQYRNTDATYPYTASSGWNPSVRASNIAANALPLLDKFYMLAEVDLNGSDSKLYFGTNSGVPAAQVLNAAGTGWNTNTGSAQGTYVSPTNPDYTYSAWALKNTVAYMANQSVPVGNFLLSIGGYNLSNNMDLAGATVGQANAAAAQIVTLMNLCNAKGVDIDYEPVGVACNPTRMATLMQAIYNAVKAYNASYEVHLTLIPSLSQADPDLKIATALACQAYADQINIMTYDDPDDLSQPTYEPGGVTVYNHTGVARSVESVQWFINAGVSRAKLGMGIAQYGRNTASPSAAFSAANPVPYNQVVAAADAAGQTTNAFPLGRFYGAVNIQNPSPTGPGNYYAPAYTALWGFDSVDTVQDKVQSASEMGLRAVFTWQISNDYANAASPFPAGNARANFALLAAARDAITNL